MRKPIKILNTNVLKAYGNENGSKNFGCNGSSSGGNSNFGCYGNGTCQSNSECSGANYNC